jgi:hypothetical protein
MVKKLIKDEQKYRGQFVATGSCNDTTVIASGKDPQKVIANAKEQW